MSSDMGDTAQVRELRGCRLTMDPASAPTVRFGVFRQCVAISRDTVIGYVSTVS
jgi:hypothetical protein